MSNTSYRDRILAKQLEAHKFDEDIIGKPLEIPSVHFTIPLSKKIQALSGPPYYVVRARRIEQTTDQLMEDLAIEYRKMIKKFVNRPKVFSSKWKSLIEAWPLDKLNDLIENHNNYYPIEANLQIDIVPQPGLPSAIT